MVFFFFAWVILLFRFLCFRILVFLGAQNLALTTLKCSKNKSAKRRKPISKISKIQIQTKPQTCLNYKIFLCIISKQPKRGWHLFLAFYFINILPCIFLYIFLAHFFIKMGLDRTPPTGDSSEVGSKTEAVIVYPVARLAAITRKKNEIETYLRIPKLKYLEANRIFNEYLEKVTTWKNECAPYLRDEELRINNKEEFLKFKEWYTLHEHKEILPFIQKMEYWLKNHESSDQVSAKDSASNVDPLRSFVSRQSNASKTSSIRLQLMQEKAQRLAEQEALKEKVELEKQEQKRIALETERKIQEVKQQALDAQQSKMYDLKLKEIELNQKARYHAYLEKSLNEYEENSRSKVSKVSQISDTKKKCCQQAFC